MGGTPDSYRLQFLPQAKEEWDKLDGSIRAQFAKILLRRLDVPRVPAAALTAMPDCYKVKLALDLLRVHHEEIAAWILDQAGFSFDAKGAPCEQLIE